MRAHEAPVRRPVFAGRGRRVLAGSLAVFAWLCSSAEASDNAIVSRSLNAKSPGSQPTRFSEIPAAQTGLNARNRYEDPRMWAERSHEFEIGAIGSGVAIGDFDNDGKPDIFIVNKTDSCRLYRNLGDFKFQDVTEAAGVGDAAAGALVWKQGTTFVDVNNDGWLDLYVCRFDAPNLLYLNQGNGTFAEKAGTFGLALSDASGMAAFCDYDRDGWLDVLVQTNLLNYHAAPLGQKNHLFHNNGGTSFTEVSTQAGLSGDGQGHSATWWDYDNDRWPDLYIANDFVVPDKLYRNNRDGTFTNTIDEAVPHMPFSAMGADVGDVDNDGLIDLLVGEMAASNHERDQRGMVQLRSQAREPADGSSEAAQVYRNVLYLNSGGSRLREIAFLAGIAATDWTWSLRFEDLDNDGRLDLFVTNGMHREATNVDLLARQMRAETVPERLRTMRDSPKYPSKHFAFRNAGDYRFDDTSKAWGLDQTSVAFGAAFGDLDGDGDLDVVYNNYEGLPTVLRNEGTGQKSALFDLRGTVSNRFGVGATVKLESALGLQARQLVLARGYMSSSEPCLHFGLGNDTIISKVTVTWPSGLVQHFENLPVDQRFTITEPAGPAVVSKAAPAQAEGLFKEVSQSVGLSFTSREEPVDEIAVQRLLPLRLNRRGPALAVGDIDGDGLEDVVVGGTSIDPVKILRAGATGFTTSLLAAPKSDVNDGPVLLFDAQANGTLALLVTKGGNSLPSESPEYQPKLFWNDGKGNFTAAPADALPAFPASVGAAAAADFNHSGKLSVFLGARLSPGFYPLTPRSALLLNHGGRFEDVTDSVAPALRDVGMVTSALWSDVDLDGWPDLLVALDWGQVKYFHNEKGVSFTDQTEQAGFAAAGTGWWTSLASADFNGDGRPDFAAGNLGLNTQYHASPSKPAVLFSGDFRGEGETPQIVEAYHEDERLYPRRGRKDLGASLPFITRKFPRNDAYARATVTEILGAEKLSHAQRFEATEFRSGVFLSQSDGTYRFSPLPSIAQISPFQGLVAGDFNGDSHADLYAVQNSYAPVASIGRFDSGLSQLLLGDGHGTFAAVPPSESQLLVPGDAKALVSLDLNSDNIPDFLISRNNSTSLAFANRPTPGHSFLRIHLVGTSGNPTAVGARLTLTFRDGTTATTETSAGSGFYSQSSPSPFFAFTAANPPATITITWPNGTTTSESIPPGTKLLTSHQPQ